MNHNNYYQVIQSCLVVTVAGAWGQVGDRITVGRWYRTTGDSPTYRYVTYFNEDLPGPVTGIDTSNSEPCPRPV